MRTGLRFFKPVDEKVTKRAGWSVIVGLIEYTITPPIFYQFCLLFAKKLFG